MTTDPFDYQLKKFDATSFPSTKRTWERQLADNSGAIFASDYQRILDWAGTCIDDDGNNGNSFAYGIFKGNSHHADAIVELVYVKPARKWLKLLNLHLCPSVDLSFHTQDIDIKQLSHIFAAAVVGTVRLTSTAHPTKVTKLYGRSGTLLSFLKGLGAYIEGQNIPRISVSIEGRWLVMKVKG
jgi:hypothetical protein